LNWIAIFMSSRSIDFLFACEEHNFASSNTSVKYPIEVKTETENQHNISELKFNYHAIFSPYHMD